MFDSSNTNTSSKEKSLNKANVHLDSSSSIASKSTNNLVPLFKENKIDSDKSPKESKGVMIRKGRGLTLSDEDKTRLLNERQSTTEKQLNSLNAPKKKCNIIKKKPSRKPPIYNKYNNTKKTYNEMEKEKDELRPKDTFDNGSDCSKKLKSHAKRNKRTKTAKNIRMRKRLCSFNQKNPSAIQNGRKTKMGVWKKEEQALFLQAISLYGNDYQKLSEVVQSRNPKQISSHAQRYVKHLCEKYCIRSIESLSDLDSSSIIDLNLIESDNDNRNTDPLNNPRGNINGIKRSRLNNSNMCNTRELKLLGKKKKREEVLNTLRLFHTYIPGRNPFRKKHKYIPLSTLKKRIGISKNQKKQEISFELICFKTDSLDSKRGVPSKEKEKEYVSKRNSERNNKEEEVSPSNEVSYMDKAERNTVNNSVNNGNRMMCHNSNIMFANSASHHIRNEDNSNMYYNTCNAVNITNSNSNIIEEPYEAEPRKRKEKQPFASLIQNPFSVQDQTQLVSLGKNSSGNLTSQHCGNYYMNQIKYQDELLDKANIKIESIIRTLSHLK